MKLRIIGRIKYTTAEGDTFDTLALAAYNEERMSSVIIAENPDYADVVIFDAGVSLSIPVLETIETPETLPPWRRLSQ
jgi:phage tail protein X